MVISWRQIFVISLLIFISFLNLTFYILHMSKNQLFIVQGYVLKCYVSFHLHLKNTLRVNILGLESVVIQRNFLTINLEG